MEKERVVRGWNVTTGNGCICWNNNGLGFKTETAASPFVQCLLANHGRKWDAE